MQECLFTYKISKNSKQVVTGYYGGDFNEIGNFFNLNRKILMPGQRFGLMKEGGLELIQLERYLILILEIH